MKQKAFTKLYGDLLAAGPGHRIPCHARIILARDQSRAKITPTAKQKEEKGNDRHVAEPGCVDFPVLLLGAALMANVSDGPMSAYRGSWLTRASR